jgi:hypothetical protein
MQVPHRTLPGLRKWCGWNRKLLWWGIPTKNGFENFDDPTWEKFKLLVEFTVNLVDYFQFLVQ